MQRSIRTLFRTFAGRHENDVGQPSKLARSDDLRFPDAGF